MIHRCDVVMVEFPYTDTAQSKVRPAVVVLNDRDNQRLRKELRVNERSKQVGLGAMPTALRGHDSRVNERSK
jgi:mRNA-degrading endonuclease toxin of MazEF toxin-antitoxin module